MVDENRATLNGLRSSYQQAQRSQFDAEKKVAVADTSIQNLQRTIFHLEEEREARQEQMAALEGEKEEKKRLWHFAKPIWKTCSSSIIIRKNRSLKHRRHWKLKKPVS